MIDLKTATYKGVEFLFEDMPTTGGNRLIKFNYPGSDNQAIERQGKAPRTFTINAIIQHDNYYKRRDDLLRVLEDGEKGILIHPTFGEIANVYSGIYTLNETTTELGRATISIPFEISDAVGIPIKSADLVSQVQVESDLLNDSITADVVADFEVTNSLTGNFQDAVNKLKDLNKVFDNAMHIADPLISEVNDANALLKSFDNQINKLIGQPSNLVSSVLGIFNSITNLYSTPAGTIKSLSSIFKFGDNDTVIQQTTVSKVQRVKNREVLNTAVNVAAINNAYLSAAQVEYKTTEDIDLVQVQLENQYTYIRDNLSVSNTTLEQLDRVRVQTLKTLDNARVNTRQIITVTVTNQPLSVIAYSYYGNTDLVDTLAELNNIKRNAFVEGDIKILTA